MMQNILLRTLSQKNSHDNNGRLEHVEKNKVSY